MTGPFGEPIGTPLGGGSSLFDLLRDLRVGETASVLNNAYPHDNHIDATLYQKFPDGQIYPIDKVHLDPRTLTER